MTMIWTSLTHIEYTQLFVHLDCVCSIFVFVSFCDFCEWCASVWVSSVNVPRAYTCKIWCAVVMPNLEYLNKNEWNTSDALHTSESGSCFYGGSHLMHAFRMQGKWIKSVNWDFSFGLYALKRLLFLTRRSDDNKTSTHRFRRRKFF